MTAVVVVLSVTLLAAVGGLIAMGVALRSSLASERASMAVEGIASRQQLLAERDRDQAIAARVQAERERDDAQAALVATQSLVVNQSKEAVERVKAQAESGDAAGAVDVLNGVLSRPLMPDDVAADLGDTGHDSGDAE